NVLTARVIPTILWIGSDCCFMHVKRDTCIVGTTLAVVLTPRSSCSPHIHPDPPRRSIVQVCSLLLVAVGDASVPSPLPLLPRPYETYDPDPSIPASTAVCWCYLPVAAP